VSDVGALVNGATKAGKRIATFAMDGQVRFASAEDRAAFTDELATAVTALVSASTTTRTPRAAAITGS